MSGPQSPEQTSPLSWSRPSGLDGLGLVFSVAAWGVLAGPLGVLFGGILACAVIALTAPFAFAVGQVLVLGVLNEASVVDAAIAEAGLILILLHGFAPRVHQYRFQLKVVAIIVVIVASGYAATLADIDLWAIVMVGAVLWSLITYGLHRFELVQLNLITEEP